EMVGREKELNKLELHVLRVINGEGSIVSVIGEAGIGKSRLITELKSKDVINRVRLLEGRALSFGKNLSYHPIIDILKKWAAIKEDDTETESISKLEKAIGNIYPEGVAEVFPFIATLMGMKLNGKYADRIKGIEGEAMEKLILKNTRELMIKAAEHNPIVYIIEDLHWADLTSIELLESLFRLAESQKILFINVLRPDYQETGDRILETIKERCGNFHSEIYLEPLDEKQCEVLIENLTKASELPRDISTAIANRAEGNPFFIEEVVHSFIDEGVIELKDGKFKVTEKIVSVVIPETIQEVLMARIDRLDENTRALLKVASVLGRHFFYKVLAEVAKTIEHIDERLEYLKRVQLIRERRRLDEVEYFFKNALAQEVTYESILLRKRKVLHLQAAKAIESVFSKRLHEFYGMLAMHYSRADEMEKTEEYLIKAGEEALKAAASTEALNYYQQALKLYLQKSEDAADREKRAILEKNIALAFYNKGYMAEAMEHFDKTLECLGEKISKNTFIQASKFLINLSSVLINLYRPSKKKKKALGKKDIEILELLYKRGNALANIDSKRFFIETMGLFRKLNRFDLKGLEGAGGMYSGGSALFSLTGISFSISQKFLDVSKRIIGKNEVKSILLYKFFEGVHNYFAGNWDSEYEIDEELINATLRLGELYMVTLYVGTCFHIALGCGEFEYATGLIDKVSKISESYDYDWGRLYRHISELKYRLEK
ncbi:MAG: AAA family ATPase, partial [Candidatus Aminicenantales bacterium]